MNKNIAGFILALINNYDTFKTTKLENGVSNFKGFRNDVAKCCENCKK